MIRRDHRAAEQVADGGVPQTGGRVVTDGLGLGELGVGAQQQTFEFGVAHQDSTVGRDVGLVQLLAGIPHQIEGVVARGRGGPAQRSALRDSEIREELVGVLGHRVPGGGGVALQGASGLRPVDVVHIEVGRLLLIHNEIDRGVRDRLGLGGARDVVVTGLVVLHGRRHDAGDVNGVAATEDSLVLAVGQTRPHVGGVPLLQHRRCPQFGDEIGNCHVALSP